MMMKVTMIMTFHDPALPAPRNSCQLTTSSLSASSKSSADIFLLGGIVLYFPCFPHCQHLLYTFNTDKNSEIEHKYGSGFRASEMSRVKISPSSDRT